MPVLRHRTIDRIQNLQTRSLENLLDDDRLKRMVANEQVNGREAYAVVELLDDLRKGIFEELYNSEKVDAYRRNLQRSYVDAATAYVQELKGERSNELLKSDILALMRGEMEQLKRDINQRRGRTNNKLTSYHWNDLVARIDAGLNTDS